MRARLDKEILAIGFAGHRTRLGHRYEQLAPPRKYNYGAASYLLFMLHFGRQPRGVAGNGAGSLLPHWHPPLGKEGT